MTTGPSEHVCDWCRADTRDSVDLSGLSDRCAYHPQGRGRCLEPAIYEVGLVYCWEEHCVNDPAHGPHCGDSPDTTHVCAEHGLVMRTRPDLWQCFRTIRTLALAGPKS